MTAPGPVVSDFDREHIAEIMADTRGDHWSWFSCRLLRLMATADGWNLGLLGVVYPDHLRAFLEWQQQGAAVCRRCHEQPALLDGICGNCADDLYQERLADQMDPGI